MEIELNNNLHPKYTLIGNDVELMKKFVSNISVSEMLPLIPKITINKNAIFYSNSLSSDEVIGSSPVTKKFKKFTFDVDLAENKKEITHIYYSKEEIQVLDFTQITAVLGFNVLSFFVEGELFQIDDNVILDYCRNNQADGYITLEPHRRYANCYSDGKTGNSVCPTIYLRNKGLNSLTLLGMIHLERKKELTYDELLQLNDLLFCSINNLFDISINIKTEPIITHGMYHTVKYMYNNKEYDIKKILKNKGMLSILDLSYVNLGDGCTFQFYDNIEEIIADPLNDKYDIVTGKEIDSGVADKLVEVIFKNIAKEYNINPFLLNHYTDIAEIDGYEQIISFIENASSIDEIKEMFDRLEKDIVDRIRKYDKKSDINFINLQLLKTTHDYVTRNIVGSIFNNIIEEVISILNGIDLKQYTFLKFLKVDLLIIDICYKKLTNHKIIYQTLLNDVALVVMKPSIDMNLIKVMAKITQSEFYKELKALVYPTIYDMYKHFLKGNVDFNDLYAFLQFDAISNFIYFFANNNDIQITLLQQYNDLIQLPTLKTAVKNINNMDINQFKAYLDTLSTYIITSKIVNATANVVGLDINLNNVKKFLESNVEKYLSEQIDNPTSTLNNIKNDTNFDYYKFINNDLNVEDVINYIENTNDNDVMIEYIYKELKIPLIEKEKVLRLLGNKNLLDIFVSYLQGEITLGELKKLVIFKFDKPQEKRARRSSNEKKSEKRKKRREEVEEVEEEEEEEEEYEELTEEM